MMAPKPYAAMTIEALLVAAGSPVETPHTYLYVGLDGQLRAMEKPDRTARPIDEADSYGYAAQYMRQP